MKQYMKQNFDNAMKLPMPGKTFAKLGAKGDYVALQVRPGLINKHVTSEQLITLANLEKEGSVKYSAGHSFIVTIQQNSMEEAIEMLTQVGLYVVPPTPCATLKCCDFCDGDVLDALPLARQLLLQIEQMPMKQRIRIGFNACTLACYNAVQDDLGLVFHNGKVDVYGGAIPMGRRARSGQLLMKNVPEQQILNIIQQLLTLYNTSPVEKFATFIKREKATIQLLQ